MTELAWDELTAAEPRLAELAAHVQAVADDPAREWFCANRTWHGGGFKRELVRLVGWQRDKPQANRFAGRPEPMLVGADELEVNRADELAETRRAREQAQGLGLLWTTDAYEVAYQHLYEQLPACRNCQCT